MPIPVQLIFRDNPGELPAEQELAPGLDMEFVSSRVRVDGSAAVEPFVVVLEALAADGTIMAQSRPEQVFEAGDTGVVTYAPF